MAELQCGFGDWNMRMRLRIIPHKEQRYDTIGDWELVNDDHGWPGLEFRISDMTPWAEAESARKMMFAAFMHELHEALLYLFKRNFSKESVRAIDIFDMHFGDILEEPGADPLAPYYAEHMSAMEVEHAVASQVQLDWNDYTRVVSALGEDDATGNQH